MQADEQSIGSQERLVPVGDPRRVYSRGGSFVLIIPREVVRLLRLRESDLVQFVGNLGSSERLFLEKVKDIETILTSGVKFSHHPALIGDSSGYLPREDKPVRIEAHVAGICIRRKGRDWEVLLAKRAPHRELYAQKWDTCGGQLRAGENGKGAVERHFREELGAIVEVVDFVTHYETGKKKEVPGWAYVCRFLRYANGKDFILDPRAYDEKEPENPRWVKVSEINTVDPIPELGEEILLAVSKIETSTGLSRRRWANV